jgi:MFS transporter, MHS family, proline/betaine transporter
MLDARQRRRVVWCATLGNGLEWFDFIAFGLFATTIGKLFFPAGDPVTGILAAYGLFAAAYVARPLGGIFFGISADRRGRKRALINIVLMMACGTALIGVLPTYETIGFYAPAGLTLPSFSVSLG